MKKNDKHIGNVKLEPINFKEKKATIGVMIGDKDYWGMGFGVEVIKLLVDYAFNVLGLREVNLGVSEDHKKAIRAYEKAGFQITHRKREFFNNKHGYRIYMCVKRD